MKKHAFVIAMSISFVLNGQSGRVIETLSLDSKILKMERKYAVYLPPDYETSERSYPVLYLLHGASDDQTGWIQFGEVMRITDEAIKNGTATPMVIIMPDADTKYMGYANHPDGNWNYEDFFFDELMPHVEEKFRIKSQKRYRAVSGLSMGGGGTFAFALHRPDLFQSACPLSASTGPVRIEDIGAYFKRRNIQGNTQKDKEWFFKKYCITELVKSMDTKEISSVRWYIDCGDDDFVYEGNSLIHIDFRKRDIPHEYRVRDGAHNWTYWRESLPEVLRFISDGFHQY